MGLTCSKSKGSPIRDSRSILNTHANGINVNNGAKNNVKSQLPPESAPEHPPRRENFLYAQESRADNGTEDKQPASWKEVFLEVAQTKAIERVPRHARGSWKDVLTSAEETKYSSNKSMPEAQYLRIIGGNPSISDVTTLTSQDTVRLYVCSVGRETVAERAYLHQDVFPYLQKLCDHLEISFEAVDLNRSASGDTSERCTTEDLSLREIDRCFKESRGPAFLCLLTETQGDNHIPSFIPKHEFETLYALLLRENKDASILTQMYQLDRNNIEEVYTLRNAGSETNAYYQNAPCKLAKLLKLCQGLENLSSQDKGLSNLFHETLFYKEINQALGQFEAADRSIFIQRHLNEQGDDTVRECDKTKVNISDVTVEHVTYQTAEKEACLQSIRDMCDLVCRKCVEKILENIKHKTYVNSNYLISDILEHARHSSRYSKFPIGREEEINKIREYLLRNSQAPLFIRGESGCGKSTLVALCDNIVRKDKPKSILVVRYCGLTVHSRASFDLLRSIVHQVTVAYNKDREDIPQSYHELIHYFKNIITLASKDRPLVIVIDSIDTMLKDNMGRRFLSFVTTCVLPNHTKLIVSFLPNVFMDASFSGLNNKNVVQIGDLKPAEGHFAIINELKMRQRTLTVAQQASFDSSFTGCPSPLFLDLSHSLLRHWRSFDTLSAFPQDVPSLVNVLFETIENRCDKAFVHHSVAYMLASRFGLTECDMLMILSNDPYISQMNQALHGHWLLLKQYLSNLTIVTNNFDQSVMSWRNKQIQTVAENRYLGRPLNGFTSFADKAYSRLASHFGTKYAESKQKVTDLNRNNQVNLTVKSGSAYRLLLKHTRLILEYDSAIIHQQNWKLFKELWSDIEMFKTMFKLKMEEYVLQDLSKAAVLSKDKHIVQMFRFMSSYRHVFQREPDFLFQLASQVPMTHMLHQLFDGSQTIKSTKIVRAEPKTMVSIQYELKIMGTGSGFQSCAFSPEGDKIVATDNRGGLHVWDSMTGECLLTLAALPKGDQTPANFSADNSPAADLEGHYTDNPASQFTPRPATNQCCFTQDAVAIATEFGDMFLYDMAGKEIARACTENGQTIGITATPERKLLITAFNNGAVYICDASTLSHVATIQTETPNIGLSVAPDGKKAVTLSQDKDGLALIDLETFTMRRITNMSMAVDRSTTDIGIMKGKDTEASNEDKAVHSEEKVTTDVNDSELHEPNQLTDEIVDSESVDKLGGDAEHVIYTEETRVSVLNDSKCGHEEYQLIDGVRTYDKLGTTATTLSHDTPSTPANEKLSLEVDNGRACIDFNICCAFHPNCVTVMIGSYQGLLIETDTSGRSVGHFRGHRGAVWSIRFNKDGSLMYTASADRSVKAWRHTEGGWSYVSSFDGHSKTIMAIDIQPTNQTELVSASLDGSIRVWPIKDEPSKTHLLRDKNEICEQSPWFRGLNPDQYDVATFSPKAAIVAIRMGPDLGAYLLQIDGSYCCRLQFDTDFFMTKGVFDLQEEFILTLGLSNFSKEGKMKSLTIRVFDLDTCKQFHDFSNDVLEASDVACGPDYIVIGTCQGEVLLFDRKSFSCLMTWCGVKPINLLACSPVDNIILVTSGPDTTLLTIGETLKESWATIPSHESDVIAAEFSPLGSIFVTGTTSGRLRVWKYSPNTVKCSFVYKLQSCPLRNIRFSDSGITMVTCSEVCVSIWSVDTELELTGRYYGSFVAACFLDRETLLASEATGRLIKLKF